MTEFTLPYGKTQLTVQIPPGFQVDCLNPHPSQPMDDANAAINNALADPLGRLKLENFTGAKTVGIAINDKTRPLPNPNPLFPLLRTLDALGFTREATLLFISSGSHEPMMESELIQLLGNKVLQQYPVFIHDCDQSPMVDLGQTRHQTPYQINAAFYHCDLKISMGNIEPHHFMGFSGGVKTAVIGLASRATINANHAMLTHQKAISGVYDTNPMRQDVEEMGEKAGIQFSLGTILDEQKNIIRVYFGEPVVVMQLAIPVVRQIFGVKVSEPYDLVIASPGGAPKDINLYQAQKGLTHAARITRDGGTVVLLAACPEGSGSPSYETYVSAADSHASILEDFNTGYFKVGPHKAFQIAREAVRVNFHLVTDIFPDEVRRWKLTPTQPDQLETLIHQLTHRLPQNARIAILPAATRTMAEVIP